MTKRVFVFTVLFAVSMFSPKTFAAMPQTSCEDIFMTHQSRVMKVIQIFDGSSAQATRTETTRTPVERALIARDRTELNRAEFNAAEINRAELRHPAIAHLEEARALLLKEQVAARDRNWSSADIEEIRQKGRIELDSPERAIKFYRGLIVWKLRILQEQIEKITEDETLALFKAQWPATVKVTEATGATVDVPLFLSPADFHRARRVTEGLQSMAKEQTGLTQNDSLVRAPSLSPEIRPEQLAAVLQAMSRIRGQRRNSAWADQGKLQATVLQSLQPYFPGQTISFEFVKEASLELFKLRDSDCCGSGRCEACTHPNVVFRDKTKWPAPTHLNTGPPSTLPLHQVMDRLKESFPEENWGESFWDARVRFEQGRVLPKHD